MAEQRPEEEEGGRKKIEDIIIRIPADGNEKEPTSILEGDLILPNNNNKNTTKGIVIFAQGINLFLRLSIMMVLQPC
jgi:hypothetical protein